MHRHRTFICSDLSIYVRAEESDANATPWVKLDIGCNDARRDTDTRTLTGADAAAFIAWSNTVPYVDSNAVYFHETPDELEQWIPQKFRLSHAGERIEAA